MHKKSVIILVIGSILIGLIAIYISFLPKLIPVTVSQKCSVNIPDAKLYLDTPTNWINWMVQPQNKVDKVQNVKNQTGTGAVGKWWSEKLGDGAIEILTISDSSINYQLISDNNSFRERGKLIFKSINSLNNDSITITWLDTLDISTSLPARWQAETIKKHISSGNSKMLNQLILNLNEFQKYRKQD